MPSVCRSDMIKWPSKLAKFWKNLNFSNFKFQIQIPSKVENFLFNGIILGWFALQNIFINEKFYCWNPDGNITKEEVLANLAINKDWDIHGHDFVPSYNDWNWTVKKTQSGRSKGKWLYDLKYWSIWSIWSVSRDKSRRSKGMKMDGLKKSKWTVEKAKTGRSKGLKLDGPKEWNWTVLKNQCGRSRGQKMDGLKGWNWTVILERSLWWNWGSGDIRVRIQLGLE